MDFQKRGDGRLRWSVDEAATKDELHADPGAPLPSPGGGGRVVYIDENGQRRRLPANLRELSAEERDAALDAMSQALGAAPLSYAKVAAIEHLTELRAAGTITEEHFERERRRLEQY